MCVSNRNSNQESPFHGRRANMGNHYHKPSIVILHSLSSSIIVCLCLSLSLIISSSHHLIISIHHRSRCHRIISIIHHHFLLFLFYSINLCHWLEYSKAAIKNRTEWIEHSSKLFYSIYSTLFILSLSLSPHLILIIDITSASIINQTNRKTTHHS